MTLSMDEGRSQRGALRVSPPTPVALPQMEGQVGDIRDVRAYVIDVIRRTIPEPMDGLEHEEMVNEGVVIVLELHSSLDPALYDSFSAFARRLLKNRLIDWLRVETRQRGIGYRDHSNAYVSLNRTSYETLAETDLEPAVWDRVTA